MSLNLYKKKLNIVTAEAQNFLRALISETFR